MNKFVVKDVIINENKIKYNYEVIGPWKKYFDLKKEFKIEYTIDISQVPVSICIIPLITDILPISWIFDAEIILEEIDKNFYESIKEFKKGFVNMYPTVKFLGKIKAKKIVDNTYNVSERVGAFFSGGVDAMSTLITHKDETPILINLQGSDIDVNDIDTINNVKLDILNTAKEFNTDAIFVKSTFKNIIRHRMINLYISPRSGDNYWHGFQHGIAIIGHAAPIAYLYRMKRIYIASSFTKEDKVTCASDPTIDNYVKLSNTEIYHDGYNYNRGDKIRNIIKYCRENDKKLKLRVCFDEHNPENCCRCEKCYRTMFEIIANGYDPRKLGFNYNDDIFKNVEKEFNDKIMLGHTKHWDRIQKTFIENEEKFKDDDRFKWIFTYKFTTKKTAKKCINKIYNAIKKRVKKYIWRK